MSYENKYKCQYKTIVKGTRWDHGRRVTLLIRPLRGLAANVGVVFTLTTIHRVCNFVRVHHKQGLDFTITTVKLDNE